MEIHVFFEKKLKVYQHLFVKQIEKYAKNHTDKDPHIFS
jgi:hypothetical protein